MTALTLLLALSLHSLVETPARLAIERRTSLVRVMG
jgi:hypothetical protein